MVSLKSWVFYPENGSAYKSSAGGTRWRCARCPDLATAKTFILKSSHIFEHLKTHDVYKPKNDEEDEDEGGGYGDDDGDGDGEGGGNEGKQEGGQEEDATVVTLRRSKRLRRGRDLGP